jgi:hypothetical protein
VNFPQELETEKFYRLFLLLMTAAPPEKAPSSKMASEGKNGAGN